MLWLYVICIFLHMRTRSGYVQDVNKCFSLHEVAVLPGVLVHLEQLLQLIFTIWWCFIIVCHFDTFYAVDYGMYWTTITNYLLLCCCFTGRLMLWFHSLSMHAVLVDTYCKGTFFICSIMLDFFIIWFYADMLIICKCSIVSHAYIVSYFFKSLKMQSQWQKFYVQYVWIHYITQLNEYAFIIFIKWNAWFYHITCIS